MVNEIFLLDPDIEKVTKVEKQAQVCRGTRKRGNSFYRLVDGNQTTDTTVENGD